MAYIPHVELSYLVKLVGYSGLFGIVFAETGLFFGFFLPGSSMLFTAGFLASQGIFNVWILMPLITLAAILGSRGWFLFGSVCGPCFFHRESPAFFRKEIGEPSACFFEKPGLPPIF